MRQEKIGECSTFENISGRSLKERSISAKWLGCIFSFLQDVTVPSYKMWMAWSPVAPGTEVLWVEVRPSFPEVASWYGGCMKLHQWRDEYFLMIFGCFFCFSIGCFAILPTLLTWIRIMFEWPIYAYFWILKKSFPETSTTTLPETNIITFNTGV